MRKLTSILTIAFLAISVSLCAQNAKKGKALVAYFSASGIRKQLPRRFRRQQVLTSTRLNLKSLTRRKTSISAIVRLVLSWRWAIRISARNWEANLLTSRSTTSSTSVSPSIAHPASSCLSSSRRTSKARPSFLLPHQAAAPSTTRSTSSKPLTQN